MNNKQITILYRMLSIIFGLISLIAGSILLIRLYNYFFNK